MPPGAPESGSHAGVPSSTATTFRVSFQERNVAIDFGRSGAAPGDKGTVALSNRIVLDASAAARLTTALRERLREHQMRWPGSLSAEAEATAARAPSRSHEVPAEAGQKAARLLRLVAGLGVPHFHERSFRMSAESLAVHRFLLSVDRQALPSGYGDSVLAICDQLGMPASLRELAVAGLEGVRCVHFGFEGDERILYKFYLEQADAAQLARNAQPGTAVLLHLAGKWDSRDPASQVTSRYHWYPALSEAAILDRIADICGAGSPSYDIARSVVEATSGQINPEDLQYLEISEDGNDRRSFDLNFYDAGLKIKDLQPQLARMRDLFSLRPGQFQAFYDQIKSLAAGHLAGGIHRNGREFFNVYYGVERRTP